MPFGYRSLNRHYQGLYWTISQRQRSEGGGAYAEL
jgi:hypothetical protein